MEFDCCRTSIGGLSKPSCCGRANGVLDACTGEGACRQARGCPGRPRVGIDELFGRPEAFRGRFHLHPHELVGVEARVA